MLKYIKSLLKFWSENGMYLPSAFDNRSGIGSVSLLFAHIANLVAIVAICLLVAKDLDKGVIFAIAYSVLMLVFYLIRSISKFKVDVDDGEINVESSEEKRDA